LILPNLNKAQNGLVLRHHRFTQSFKYNGYKTIHGIMPVTYPRAPGGCLKAKTGFGNPIRYEITTDPMNRFGKAS
jgi:hypothetical protein